MTFTLRTVPFTLAVKGAFHFLQRNTFPARTPSDSMDKLHAPHAALPVCETNWCSSRPALPRLSGRRNSCSDSMYKRTSLDSYVGNYRIFVICVTSQPLQTGPTRRDALQKPAPVLRASVRTRIRRKVRRKVIWRIL